MAGLRRNQWKGIPAPNLGRDPQGKVLGILGMGGIGKNLKKKMEAFGMTCIYHNRYVQRMRSMKKPPHVIGVLIHERLKAASLWCFICGEKAA